MARLARWFARQGSDIHQYTLVIFRELPLR